MRKGVKETGQEILDQLRRPIYVGSRLESNLRALQYCGNVITIVGIITTILNVYQGKTISACATAVIAILGLMVVYSAAALKNRKISGLFIFFICLVFFTAFALTGMNDGFAICWSLLVPLAYSYFVSVRGGFLLGVYYQILYMILFYTPLREIMSVHYTESFMLRFPVLYFCAFTLSSVSMIQYHISTLKMLEYETDLEKKVEKQTEDIIDAALKLENMSLQVVETLAHAIDAKDRYTNGHSIRVADYSAKIAEQVGFDKEEINELRAEALLHDIGKIGIPDNILNKPGRLDEYEFAEMQEHTVIGGEILEHIESLPGASYVARHHHERYDGTGYPDGLKGKDIPEHARIVSIADAYDAMKTDRIYRNRLSEAKIRKEIERERGRQFDPDYADVLTKLIEEKEI